MALAHFNIIVATDNNDGIAKGGQIPWVSKADMMFFREKTLGLGANNNVVIMGRLTYESLPGPLEGRLNVVISTTMPQIGNPGISIFPSLKDALQFLGSSLTQYKDVFVIGGGKLYNEAINDYLYLVKKIYVTRIKTNYQCDVFFPYSAVKDFPLGEAPNNTRDYVRYVYVPEVSHIEYNYLNLLRKIKEKGEIRKDRTGVGTKALFGEKVEYDISERIPLLTTKEMNFKHILAELLFFISGSTNTKLLEAVGVSIWKKNTDADFLKKRGLSYVNGDMGPLYGFQLRHWGAEYFGMDKDYTGEGIDQLSRVIEGIKTDPFSRRHVINYWNVSDLDKMVLNPCHVLVQFNVSSDNRHLDAILFQRSGDCFLGIPFNVCSYTILTYMIAHICNLKPRKFIHMLSDVHIYSNHNDVVNRQLQRTPLPAPTLRFKNPERILNIDDFNIDNVEVVGYQSLPALNARMAV